MLKQYVVQLMVYFTIIIYRLLQLHQLATILTKLIPVNLIMHYYYYWNLEYQNRSLLHYYLYELSVLSTVTTTIKPRQLLTADELRFIILIITITTVVMLGNLIRLIPIHYIVITTYTNYVNVRHHPKTNEYDHINPMSHLK